MSELVRRKGRRGIDAATKDRAVELYQAGELTVPEIARVCQISARSVFRIMEERRTERGAEEESS